MRFAVYSCTGRLVFKRTERSCLFAYGFTSYLSDYIRLRILCRIDDRPVHHAWDAPIVEFTSQYGSYGDGRLGDATFRSVSASGLRSLSRMPDAKLRA